MAVFSLYLITPPTPQAHSSYSSSSSSSSSCFYGRGIYRRRNAVSRFVVLSTHSSPRILKLNKKSRSGQVLSPFDSDEDKDYEEGDSDGDGNDWNTEDGFSDSVDFAELAKFDAKRNKFKSCTEVRKGNWRNQGKSSGKSMLNYGQRPEIDDFDACHSTSNIISQSHTSYKGQLSSLHMKGRVKESMAIRFPRLMEEIELDEKWFPLLDYLSSFGLKESHFIQMYERHMPSLQINVCSAQERLDYLLSLGVKQRDIRRILLRQPQILGYTVEKNLKSHVAFLLSLGIPDSKVGQIIVATPSLFSYSVENSLKPTVRYLIEEVGIKEKELGKVVQLSPQILVQKINISWNTRYMFLTKELGASRDSIVKMVKKHPQLLHYSIDDGLLPRINFLRSIGMQNSDILKVLTGLTQVLSLSLEDNLKPKYMYLINELHNEVNILTKYPMYFSLSLEQRIRPRHKFLVALKKAPKGPFPLSSFVPTDECFCQQWAGTTLDKYLAFRQKLLLKEFAKKYERKK